MKKKIIAGFAVALVAFAAAVFILWDLFKHKDFIDAFSGATPPALERAVPPGISLEVNGLVKQTYQFTSSSFRLLAKVRLRMPEITPQGKILGAYIYTGVPVLYILEGVAPQKEAGAVFDRPLDMVVTFTSTVGKKARFSYGELTMTKDGLPVTLAYHREPLLPGKNPGGYTRNQHTGNIQGLSLVCPGDRDNSRFLDQIANITLALPAYPDQSLPAQAKGTECISPGITCLWGDKKWTASYDDVPIKHLQDWFRIGHGRGIKGDGTFRASGYHLPAFLERNFPGCGPDDFFLFVGCDGYRALFSGREIFGTAAGNACLLLTGLDGKEPGEGFTLGASGDFFVDRNVRGLSHIVRIPGD